MEGDLIIQKQGKDHHCKTQIITDLSKVKSLNNPVRQKIIRYLSKKPMYASKVAEILGINEQTTYYHFKMLEEAGLIQETERKQIRGTIAKKYSVKNNAFSIIFDEDNFAEYTNEKSTSKKVPDILNEFINYNMLDAKIIVGSPQPHGPHKAIAKDGHYAIDLGLFIGNHASLSEDMNVSLDVGIDLDKIKNAIIVGGPVTNLICYKVNKYLPCKFSDKRPWGIITEKSIYTDDSVGMIARIKNPFNEEGHLLVIAGIRGIGTKSAVIAMTRNIERVMGNKKLNDEFYCVVQGYDLDADGKIDSIEILERSND